MHLSFNRFGCSHASVCYARACACRDEAGKPAQLVAALRCGAVEYMRAHAERFRHCGEAADGGDCAQLLRVSNVWRYASLAYFYALGTPRR